MSATRPATRPATERPVRLVTDCPNISRLCESNDKAQWVVIGAIFAGAISASFGCMALAGVNGLCQMGITGGVVLISGGTLILIMTTLFSMYRHAPTYLNDLPIATDELGSQSNKLDVLRAALADTIVHQLRAAAPKFTLSNKFYSWIAVKAHGRGTGPEIMKNQGEIVNHDKQLDVLSFLHQFHHSKNLLIPRTNYNLHHELECDYCLVQEIAPGQMVAFQQYIKISVGKTHVSSPHIYHFHKENSQQLMDTVNQRAQIGRLTE